MLAGSLEELRETLGQQAAETLGKSLQVVGVFPDHVVVVTDDDAEAKSVPWEFDGDQLNIGEAKDLEGEAADMAVLQAAADLGLVASDAPPGFEAVDPADAITGLSLAGVKALGWDVAAVEAKGGAYVQLPGSWEDVQFRLRDSVRDSFLIDQDEVPQEQRVPQPWVSVVATYDDHVLVEMDKYDDTDRTYWTVPWSLDDDGDPVIGTPVAVNLTASITPLTAPNDPDAPVPASLTNPGQTIDGGSGPQATGLPAGATPEAVAAVLALLNAPKSDPEGETPEGGEGAPSGEPADAAEGSAEGKDDTPDEGKKSDAAALWALAGVTSPSTG